MKPNPQDLRTCDPNELVDLSDIQIDTSLPLRERMEHYRRQIRDPYLFKVDGLIIKTVYLADAKNRLCDSLCDLLSE